MLPEPIFLTVHMYGVMIAVGLISALSVWTAYGKKEGMKEETLDFVYYNIIAAVAVGFVTAAFFQGLYDYIEDPSAGFHMSVDNITFIGGLIGGILSYFTGYFIFKKKIPDKLSDILTIMPCCITIAHGFGRVGCFFAGCCYGKPTDSFLGVKFPYLPCRVHPTQLYEAGFLFIMFAVFSVLLYKKRGRYNFPVYLSSYGVFRFFLEYLRDDARGSFIGSITPSQFWSLVMIAGGLVLAAVIYRKEHRSDEPESL